MKALAYAIAVLAVCVATTASACEWSKYRSTRIDLDRDTMTTQVGGKMEQEAQQASTPVDVKEEELIVDVRKPDEVAN
ncbi:MAG: hypothetical protein ACFCBW_03425 [Candidatus Competibacterales bacterium]